MSQNNKEAYKESFRLPDILDDGDGSVKFTDFENQFHIYLDENSYYKFNLNSTIYLDVPPSRLKTYICKHDMHWPTISYQIYGTVRLAWILMKINGITPNISFEIVPAGSEVRYLDRSDVTTVINEFGKD